MKKQLFIVTSVLAIATHANASDFYVGGKAGYSLLDNKCTIGNLCEEEDFAAGIYGGLNANDYFGFEVGYDWLGDFASDYGTGTKVDGGIEAFTFAPKLRYPMGALAVYGKAGVASVRHDEFGRETSLMGALGFDYKITDSLTTRLEYQHINDVFSDTLNDKTNLDTLFLGLAYHFGGSEPEAPEPAVVVEEPKEVVKVEPKPEPKKETRLFKEFRTGLFASDSVQLSQSSLADFDKIIESMAAFPQATLKVVGHTDATGSAEYNQQLSEKRAQAVADYIISNGVDASRVQAVGAGMDNPKASNKTAAGRTENRRVEVIIDEFEYEVK